MNERMEALRLYTPPPAPGPTAWGPAASEPIASGAASGPPQPGPTQPGRTTAGAPPRGGSSLEGRRLGPRAVRSPWWLALFWLAVFLFLVAWQGRLALGLFGDDPVDALTDERPVISGSHPQHLYLGALGARMLWRHGSTCVYDPAFQTGYLKTPIFNGSRLAEACLFAAGGNYDPAAYKFALLGACLLVPLLLGLTCRALGMSGAATVLATAAGMLVWWGPTGRDILEAGEHELLLGALTLLCHVAMLVRYDRAPGALTWCGLALTAAFVWFCQPLLFGLMLPLLLMYYLMTGTRHAAATWHLGLVGAQGVAVVVNLPWLMDWLGYWWLRSSLPSAADMLRHRTFTTIWNAPLWGGQADRGFAVVLLASGLVGASIWNLSRQRAPARLLSLGAAGLLILAFLGISWEPLGQLGTSALLGPALWFAAILAAHAWTWLTRQLVRSIVGRVVLLGWAAGIGTAVYLWHADFAVLGHRCLGTEPLQLGLGVERADVVRKLIDHTGNDARILWEDRMMPRKAPRWSALLPVLTGRSFLGGLDPDAVIEHSSISFVDQALQGLPIGLWSDQELHEYCKRYNVGWIAAWSPATLKRLHEWEGAVPIVDLTDGDTGRLFLVKRSPRNFALRGKATLVHADSKHITLADLVPENGVVVLSLHYHTGMRASPSRVQVESESCGYDPIGFVRLRVGGPVARITLTWGQR